MVDPTYYILSTLPTMHGIAESPRRARMKFSLFIPTPLKPLVRYPGFCQCMSSPPGHNTRNM